MKDLMKSLELSLAASPVSVQVQLPDGKRLGAKDPEVRLGFRDRLSMVALAMGMSKSGVFAHFGSLEELQCSVVREYHSRFEREIFGPALAAPRGLPRLLHLVAGWMGSTGQPNDASRLYGSLYISGAVEFDDRPGPVRDALASSVKTWLSAMHRAVVLAKKEGHLRADADEHQLTFEIHGLILALHYEARFLKTPGSVERALAGFERIVRDRQPVASATSPTTVYPVSPLHTPATAVR